MSVARPMFGIGAVIRRQDGRVLLLKKADDPQRHNQGLWEYVYGRKEENEEIEVTVRREALEEAGISNLRIISVVRLWNFYRGERAPDREIIGVTFLCETQQTDVILSDEHTEFRWVTLDEAEKLLTVKGHLLDTQVCRENRTANLAISGMDETLWQ